MAELKQDDLLENTYNSCMRIRDVAQNTCQRRWTIGKSGEGGSGISVLAAWHDDDDDDRGRGILIVSAFIIIIIIHSLELFTSALADGFSLESEWQQVSSSLKDFSQYSKQSKERCGLDGLDSSRNFSLFQSFFQAFGIVSTVPIKSGITDTHVLHIFLFLLQGFSICLFFRFLLSSLWFTEAAKSYLMTSSFFSC